LEDIIHSFNQVSQSTDLSLFLSSSSSMSTEHFKAVLGRNRSRVLEALKPHPRFGDFFFLLGGKSSNDSSSASSSSTTQSAAAGASRTNEGDVVDQLLVEDDLRAWCKFFMGLHLTKLSHIRKLFISDVEMECMDGERFLNDDKSLLMSNKQTNKQIQRCGKQDG